MPKTQTDYSDTIIYKLCCCDPVVTDIYIGHTTNFTKRRHQHKTACCNSNLQNNAFVYQFIRDHGGWDNWKMVQIKQHNCKDKRDAEATEHYWIEQLCPTLNTNKPYAKCKEEPQLYKHCWYEEKKDYILQKAKVNYEENKEEIIAKVKQYAELNKEKIAEHQKQYREENKEKLSEQKKIYRESHKEEAAKMHKEWREANKDKLKEERSQVIVCDCGQQITAGNKIRHLQSKIHTDYQNKLEGIVATEITEEEKLALEQEKKSKNMEQQKIYRETHAEQIKTYKKLNYEQNKEAILEQQRKYKEEHKEQLMEQNKQYLEANKERIKEASSKRYEKNKEKILQKQREVITCECGAQIRKSGKAEHLRSNKHKEQLEKTQIQSQQIPI